MSNLEGSPLVSVVIPVYNSEKTIAEAVESVIAHNQVEVIALVDGSPDHSLTVLKSLQKKYQNLKIREHSNVGGAVTLNRGLKEATGTYTAFLDGDDYYLPQGLDFLCQKIHEYDYPDVLIGKALKRERNNFFNIHDQKYLQGEKVLYPGEINALFSESSEKTPLKVFQDGFYTGKLYKTSFLRENEIWFTPNLLNADRPFNAQVFSSAERIICLDQCVAVWRKNFKKGSITDNKTDFHNFLDRVYACMDARDRIKMSSYDLFAERRLSVFDYFITYRLLWILSALSWLKNKKNFFTVSRWYIDKVLVSLAKDFTFLEFRLTKGLLKKIRILSLGICQRKLTFSLVNMLPGKVVRILTKFKRKKKTVINEVLPLDPTLVVFESFLGKEYGGQPRYLYEELLKTEKYFKAVWVYNPTYCQDLHDIPGKVIQVARGSVEYYEYLSRAKYWVNNVKFPVEYKNEGTIYLQTWHGTPLKKLSGDIKTVGPELKARKKALVESKLWNYMLAQNQYSEDIFKRAYELENCEVLNYGYPATDYLKGASQEKLKEYLNEHYGVPADKKIVTYAPTWRDSLEKKNKSWEFDFEFSLDLQKMKEALGDDYVIILRMHHLTKVNFNAEIGDLDFVYDLSEMGDVTPLLAASDILITDYSSIFFDFAVTKRDILFYMPDLDQYAHQMRELYLDVKKDLPGPVFESQEELLVGLSSLEQERENYRERYHHFYQRFLSQQQGQSAKRLIEKCFTEMPQKY